MQTPMPQTASVSASFYLPCDLLREDEDAGRGVIVGGSRAGTGSNIVKIARAFAGFKVAGE